MEAILGITAVVGLLALTKWEADRIVDTREHWNEQLTETASTD